MVKFKYLLVLVFCVTAFSSSAYAAGPRLLYVEPASTLSSSKGSLLGRYIYVGVLFADNNPSGFAGPSVKAAWGKTGRKLNVSYVAGTQRMSLELGVSYIQQYSAATLALNPEGKGYAVEAAFRLNAVSIIGVFGKNNTSIEFGAGF